MAPVVEAEMLDEAVELLTEAGLSPVFVYGEQDKNKADGAVVGQNVKADAELPKGTSVIVSLNSDTELVKTPALIGLSKDEAADKLAVAGLKLKIYTGDGYPDSGFVSAQLPAAQSPEKSGSEVTVILTDKEHACSIDIAPEDTSLRAGEEFVLRINCVNIPDLVAVNYDLSEEGIIEPVYIDTKTLDMTFKALKQGSVTVTVSYGGIEKKCSVEVK